MRKSSWILLFLTCVGFILLSYFAQVYLMGAQVTGNVVGTVNTTVVRVCTVKSLGLSTTTLTPNQAYDLANIKWPGRVWVDFGRQPLNTSFYCRIYVNNPVFGLSKDPWNLLGSDDQASCRKAWNQIWINFCQQPQ